MGDERPKASEEQLTYAGVLNIGMWIGLLVLVVTFIIYISGFFQSFVPINDLPKYWGMKVTKFNETLGAPIGWGWVSLIGNGDYLNFIGITMLSGLTVLCYMAILPILIRKKDASYIVIAILEVAVLVLAASGILKAGGH